PYSGVNGVRFRRLVLELLSRSAGAEQGLALVEGMDLHRSRPSRKLLAGRERVRVPVTHHVELRSILADTFDLGGFGDARHEDSRAHRQFPRGKGDRGSVVASGSGDHSRGGYLAQQEV